MTQRRQTALKYTLLTAAVGLIIACWLVLAGACGPAAPAAQTATSTDETLNTPTPTPDSGLADDGLPAVPPPLPTLTRLDREYPHLEGTIRDQIEQYEATQAASGASRASRSSGQSTPPETTSVIIYVDTPERVDDLENFLQENAAAQILCTKGSDESVIKGVCGAVVPVPLLRNLAEQTGVLKVEKQRVARPASNLLSPASPQTLAKAHGVAAWRLAGATGAGVKNVVVSSIALA